MRKQSFWGMIVAISFVFAGCTNHSLRKEITEGYIEYSITYDQTQPSKYNLDLLPKLMQIEFSGNNLLNKIEGLSGAVTLTFITNSETQKSITLVKLLNKKLYYEEPLIEGKYPKTFAEMPNIAIKENDETFLFHGYRCKRATAICQDSSNYTFDIIYTNDIKIENPNANTPFKSIGGVMLQFNVKLYNHLMTMTATKIKSTNISEDEFIVPPDYERVNEETINDVISLLQ